MAVDKYINVAEKPDFSLRPLIKTQKAAVISYA